MACIESYMIKHRVPVGTGSAATKSANFSETQHCFFTYSDAYDAEGMLTGDSSSSQDTCLDQGGNGILSAYTLQRWTGAASESVSALAYGKASTVASSGLDSKYAYGSNICNVQNSEWIPSTDIDAVKRAIMEYGAGNISYYETGYAYTYICTIDNTSQNDYNHKWANHAITVVGWDDSVAVSKFMPDKPSKPGAWICKNSWSTSLFDGGYCYISYEDTSVLEDYIYFYDAEPVNNYDHNYQYDGTGNVVNGYLVNASNKIANVFTAKGRENLSAISFCTYDEAVSYTVEIYKNPTANKPSSGQRMTTQSGYLTFPG
jgi:C1A family cysteine protease